MKPLTVVFPESGPEVSIDGVDVGQFAVVLIGVSHLVASVRAYSRKADGSVGVRTVAVLRDRSALRRLALAILNREDAARRRAARGTKPRLVRT